jgi:uncharacterized membrane protein YbhN (UPF0104 family)
MRLGEAVRAVLVARWLDTPVLRVVPSMVAERLMDGLWIGLGAAVAAWFVPLPASLVNGAQVLAALAAVAVLGFAVWMVRRKGAARVTPSSAALGLLCSLALAAAQALSFHAAFRAFGLHLPLGAALVVMLIVRLGTMLPGAPANIGSFQFFAALGLSLYGVGATPAASIAMLLFVLLTLPLWGLGLVALGGTGMTLHSLRRAAGSSAAQLRNSHANAAKRHTSAKLLAMPTETRTAPVLLPSIHSRKSSTVNWDDRTTSG